MAEKATNTKTHKRDYMASGMPQSALTEADLDQADELEHQPGCRSNRITTFTLPENRRIHAVRCVDCGAMHQAERSR